MSSRRRTRSAGAEEAAADDAPAAANDGLRAMRERSRAVAEREASRLARPDRPQASGALGHASKKKSAVMSTPFGQMMGRSPLGRKTDSGVQEEWCGPFSVARQMIAAREEARRVREEQQAEAGPDNDRERHPLDEATRLAMEQKKRAENPSMNWVPKRQLDNAVGTASNANYYAKRRKRFNQQKSLEGSGGTNYVPSLFQLCVNFLVDNFEHVDSLGLVDHSIRRALCERLVAQGKMNGAAFDVLAELGVETLELVDCAQVTQEQFCDALRVLLPSGLRAILLKHCGRCFGGQAVQVISEVKKEDLELFALSLSGAYLLKDDDMVRLIGSASRTLSSIDLTACPLIGTQFCQAISEHYSSVDGGAGGCLLELSLQNVPLTKEALLSLGASSDALRNLKSLKLKEIEAVDDEVVSIVLNIEGGTLEGIDLSDNIQLTDETLSSIRRCNVNGNLRALQLSGLKNLTAIGMETFFTPIEDMPSPPMLRKLDLSQCSYDEVNDAVLILAAKAASFKRSLTTDTIVEDNPNPEKLVSEISSNMGLVHVNISGSSVTDKSMEMLAATCVSSLEELDISFCANVSDKGLGYLVEKLGTQFSKLHVWGLAQLTDAGFLDCHDRIGDVSGGLQIEGVWMKKSGGRSLR